MKVMLSLRSAVGYYEVSHKTLSHYTLFDGNLKNSVLTVDRIDIENDTIYYSLSSILDLYENMKNEFLKENKLNEN